MCSRRKNERRKKLDFVILTVRKSYHCELSDIFLIVMELFYTDIYNKYQVYNKYAPDYNHNGFQLKRGGQ